MGYVPMGESFTDPVISAMVYLLLWTHAYHSHAKTFLLFYKYAMKPDKERIQNRHPEFITSLKAPV